MAGELQRIAEVGRQLRVDSIRCTTAAEAFVGVMEKPPTLVKLAVRSIPTSGTPAELLSAAGIDAEHIAQAVRERL